MKQAKPLLMILIVMLICCSYSIAQPYTPIGATGNVPVNFPGIIGPTPLGIINYGASIYPAGQVNNGAIPYVGAIRPVANVSLREFQCFLISSCGVGALSGQTKSGTIVDLGGVRSGAIVPL